MAGIQKILVATDFSEASVAAVHQAAELAEIFGARITVMHVVEDPLGYTGQLYLPEAEAVRKSLTDAARMQLDKVLTTEEVARWRGSLQLRTGTPYVEIVRLAEDHGVDLIVVGTHGRGALSHMLLGSVAEKVVRNATCPVLTVPQAKPAPASSSSK
jgi:nucleotide-binding universal stress UspA family protein